MWVTIELFMKSFKGSVLAVERTSTKKNFFGKKKKIAKKQKMKDGKKKKVEPKKKTADKKKYFFCNIDGH